MFETPYFESLEDSSSLSPYVVCPSVPFINDHNPYLSSQYQEVVLTNRERYLIESDDKISEIRPQNFFSAILALEDDKNRVYKIAHSVLTAALGYTSRDAKYWAQAAVAEDPRFEMYMPHFVHSQIIGGLSFPDGTFQASRPKFRRVHIPSRNGEKVYKSQNKSNGRRWTIQKDEVVQLLSMPPKLVSIIIPTFANRNETADAVLLRISSSTGSYIFPGGHAQSPYECTALREYNEEVCKMIKSNGRSGDWPSLRSATMVGLVDQFIVNKDNEIQRILAHVWRFSLITDFGNTRSSLPFDNLHDIASATAEANDGKSNWQYIPTCMLYHNQSLKLAAIKQVILDCDRKFLQPKPHL